MAGIYPIPVGRSSDALLTRRMMFQLQSEQKRLLHVEQQVVTGRRFQLPSEDASAANRAVSLQRILESKRQQQTNLSATQSYLDATDTALGGVADVIANARGLAVQAADTTTSDIERKAMALEIRATASRLLDVGNQQFRGRYLFAGSESAVRPFEGFGKFVAYRGNNTELRTYGNQGLLLDTNVPGQELFGAVSAEVQGSDLNPVLTAETRLADLRNGQGITKGSFLVSDGVHTSTVSIAGAETVGDVARLIEANPPPGREVLVTVEARGLRVEIDAAGGGNFTIREEQGGMTAAQLGILRWSGQAVDPIEGTDLDPILRANTRLADTVGARARAYVRSPGPNNDILLEARQRGAAMNDVTLQLVDHNLLQAAPGLSAGAEFAEFSASARAAQAGLRLSDLNNDLILRATTAGTDWNNVQIQMDASQNLGDAAQVFFHAATRTLTLAVDDSDETTLGSLVAAINGSGLFTAAPDPSRGEGYDPSAAVLAIDAGLVGATGNSGGSANTLYVYVDADLTTASQAVAALRANSEIAAMFDASVDSHDSTSTALAGSRPVAVMASGRTAGGSGIEWDQTSGLQITNGGQTYILDIRTAETIDDLLNIINGSGANVLAEINEESTGINVRSRLSGADFSIGENGGSTATDLGLRSLALNTRLADLNHRQGVGNAEGTDFTIRRNDGVELAIDIASAQTVADVVALINTHPDNLDPATAVTARLRAFGNGIELVDDDPSGTDTLQVRRSILSTAAWDLGLIPRNADVSQPPDPPAAAAEAGVAFAAPHALNTALRFVASRGGTQWNGIDIEFRSTLVGDVAVATFDGPSRRLTINMADGQTTANTVLAAVIAEGTFRAELDRLSDPTNDGSGTILAPAGAAATTSGGTAETVAGTDVNPIETQGIFNSLIRLYDAVDKYDVVEIQRIVGMLDVDFDRLTFGRAEVGARGQNLDAITRQNEDEQVELKTILSDEIDVDFAQAASDFAARQATYEAALRSISNLLKMSLLDFM